MAKKTKAAASKSKPAETKPTATKTAAPPAAKAAKTPASKAAKPAVAKPAKAPTKRAEPKAAAVESGAIPEAPAAINDSLEHRFASFEDAQSAAIDQLLQAIEDAEARLLSAKRATTFAQLEKLANGRA